MLEIDETKLSHQDLQLIDELTYSRFQVCRYNEAKKIITLRNKLGLDIQDNSMVSDFEYEYNTKIIIK